MVMKQINIRNWRSIGDKPGLNFGLGKINVIVGANDCGKTAFLTIAYASIAILSGKEDHWLYQNLYPEGSKHENENGEIEGNLEVTLNVELSENLSNSIIRKLSMFFETVGFSLKTINALSGERYLLPENELLEFFTSYYPGKTIAYSLSSLEVTKEWEKSGVFQFDNFELELNQFLSSRNLKCTKETLDHLKHFITQKVNVFPRQLKEENTLESFYISSNRYYDPSRQSGSDLRDDEIKNHTIAHDLSELVKYIQKVRSGSSRREKKYDKLKEYVKIIFPEIIEIETDYLEGERAQKDVYIIWELNGRPKRQPLSRSGAGVVNIIYIACRLICDVNKSRIAFIDEPETGLHPKLQVRFMKLLRQLSKDYSIQWVVATHSPFIMKNLKEDEKLYLFEHDGIQTTARLIEPVDKHQVFEALGAFLPETLTSKGILFVEGATESEIIPLILEKCGMDIEKEGLLIIPLGGDNLFQIEPSDLKKVHHKVMVILDSDLCKPESDGGSVKQKKLNYQEKCAAANVEFFMSRDYRYIESIYPKNILTNVLGINEEDLTYGPYDEVSVISENSKVKVGRKVAEALSEEQAKELPFIKEILKWWD